MSLEAFPRRVVINLPHRTDRRREMEEQLNRIGATAEFFPALRYEDRGPFYHPGVRGCYMSHLTLLRCNVGAPSLLLMEDDLDFVSERTRLIITRQLPENWGVFYGAVNDSPWIGPRQGYRQVEPDESFRGTHFYAVNGPAIHRLVTALETFLNRPDGHPDGGPMPIDGALNVFRRQHPDILTVVATPCLGYQRSSQSDIATPKWFETGFTGPIIANARRIRNRLRAR